MLASIVLRLAEEGGEHGGLPETPKAWLPESYEIIYGGIAFVVVAGLIFKFAIPALKKALAARSEQIEKDLVHAHNDQVSAQNDAAYVRKNLGDIDAERSRLLAEADAEATRVLTDGRARFEVEVRELEAQCRGRYSRRPAAGSRANCKCQVASIAAAATEHVVQGSLDSATHASPHRRLHREDRSQIMSAATDRIDAYANALFDVASAEGRIDEVEDELFRFGRALEAPTRSGTR